MEKNETKAHWESTLGIFIVKKQVVGSFFIRRIFVYSFVGPCSEYDKVGWLKHLTYTLHISINLLIIVDHSSTLQKSQKLGGLSVRVDFFFIYLVILYFCRSKQTNALFEKSLRYIFTSRSKWMKTSKEQSFTENYFCFVSF